MKKKFVMPNDQALAAMNQAQLTKLVQQLSDKNQKLTLVCKWAMLKSNRAHRAKQQELEANQTATALRTEALRRDQARTRQDQVKMGRALVNHNQRLMTSEHRIVQVAQVTQAQHKQAMKSIGSVVHAMFENDALIHEEKRRSAARFDYLMRYAAKLERDLQETQVVRETEQERMREIETEMVQMRQEQERSFRLMRELPEFKITRALVLMGQSCKEGLGSLFGWRPARVLGAAALIIALGAAFSHSQIKTARAQSPVVQMKAQR